MKRLIVALCLAVFSGGAIAQEAEPGGSPAKQTPDATLTLSGGLVGAGIGYSWGHGTLSYHGQEVAFCVWPYPRVLPLPAAVPPLYSRTSMRF
jgi:hypothetical protein